MSFTGHEDHSIPLSTAAEWTANYRESMPQGAPIANFFGRDAIEEILAQNGCVGIRIYYAINDQDKPNLILVGVNADGNDQYQEALAEMALQSPPYNSVDNPLNS
jgi:hypothetical protein